ncbi:MAG: hypothetical protein HC847_10290 [Hydrococcus sp. RU_2_2]|jgi:hypothetical protein|nr:hypothetical protein [Hydrococcus sp. RU_2_2]NJP18128.1 hypothetical protein [Hydrococcus sp. CRU_1_1]NJQ97076.1 hypothetical protein [Hydrococcus sp. CSU_1_8]
MLNKKIVFEGQKGLYSTTGIIALPANESPKVKEAEKILQKLGFDLLGDLSCSQFAAVVIYCYVKPEGNTWATIMKTVTEQGESKFAGYEFFTDFSSGASLTTTITKLAIEDFKAQKIFRRSHPDLGPLELYNRHQAYIQELEQKQGMAKTVDDTLEAIAASIDDYLVRQNSNSIQTITSTIATYINAIGIVLNKEISIGSGKRE